MKIFPFVIVLCLIIFSYQNCDNGNKKEDCKLSETDKENGIEYCCFLENPAPRVKSCHGLTKYQYKHIKDYAKFMRLSGTVVEEAKLDCNSKYFQLSIISLLLLLFF